MKLEKIDITELTNYTCRYLESDYSKVNYTVMERAFESLSKLISTDKVITQEAKLLLSNKFTHSLLCCLERKFILDEFYGDKVRMNECLNLLIEVDNFRSSFNKEIKKESVAETVELMAA